MLSSRQSQPEDDGGRFKFLIDQRNALADVHGHFSAAVSESSDTPSVYSHSYFSPRPSETGESHLTYPYSTGVSTEKDAGYNARNDLDRDEDSRMFYTSEVHRRNKDTSDEDAGDDDARTIARMSYLGPKMRFHSRAPWEEDALQEEEDEGFVPFPSKNTIKNIASSFSSPRPSFTSSLNRPSEDSSNSQPSTKRSFETVNSQLSFSHPRGGLCSLAQESMSTNSLGQHRQNTGGNRFPTRLRNETSHVPCLPHSSSPFPSPVNARSPMEFPQTPADGKFSSDSRRSSPSELSRNESIHPYANPDLVISYAEEGAVDKTSRTHFSRALPRDSKLASRESISVETLAKSGQSTLTPDSSMISLGSKFRSSSINTKSISLPVSVIGSAQPFSRKTPERIPGVQQLPGWTERSSSAPFTLISLEEARAQRLRTSTDTDVSSFVFGSTPLSCNDSGSASTLSQSLHATRARGRSVSAGAKAKNVLQCVVGQTRLERRDSDSALRDSVVPPGLPVKTLKNKRSGLMRLFNKEKENQDPPPVPALPEGIQSSTVAHRNALALQRVPGPPISPIHPASSSSGSSWQTEKLTANYNQKRSPHTLSIHTTSTATTPSTPPQPPNRLIAHDPDSNTQSAPPNLLEFPVLKLRPVSTLFSASFGDLVPTVPHTCKETTNYRSPTTLSSSASTCRPNDDNSSTSGVTAEGLLSTKNWNMNIWELEGQIRDLKAELAELKARSNDDFCDKCGRGRQTPPEATGVVNRHGVGHRLDL